MLDFTANCNQLRKLGVVKIVLHEIDNNWVSTAHGTNVHIGYSPGNPLQNRKLPPLCGCFEDCFAKWHLRAPQVILQQLATKALNESSAVTEWNADAKHILISYATGVLAPSPFSACSLAAASCLSNSAIPRLRTLMFLQPIQLKLEQALRGLRDLTALTELRASNLSLKTCRITSWPFWTSDPFLGISNVRFL